jgi:hypothetical protein
VRKLVIAATVAITLVSCSSAADDPGGVDVNSTADERRGVDVNSTADVVKLMRDTLTFDYEPYPAAGDMLEAVDIALVGEVVSVDSALQQLEDGPPVGAVIVGLHPREMWKDDPSRSGDVVYHWFNRPTNLDISLYQKGLPEDTQIVLFGHDATDTVTFAESDVEFDNNYTVDPQGYFIEVHDRLVNVWNEDTASSDWAGISNIDDLRTSLGK